MCKIKFAFSGLMLAIACSGTDAEIKHVGTGGQPAVDAGIDVVVAIDADTDVGVNAQDAEASLAGAGGVDGGEVDAGAVDAEAEVDAETGVDAEQTKLCKADSGAYVLADCDGNKATGQDGCEVDLWHDTQNCAACGNVCPVYLKCVSGECKCASAADCTVGWTGLVACVGGYCQCGTMMCPGGQFCTPAGCG